MMRNTTTGWVCCQISNSEKAPSTTIRKKAAEIFDPPEYTKRLLIDGAEETRRYQLHTRCLRGTRTGLLKAKAITWNIRTLNRFECVRNVPITSYDRAAHAEYT